VHPSVSDQPALPSQALIFFDADIDGNGIVNAADLTYLLAGFNKRDVDIDMLDK
jgi:hypothetical protein